MKTRFLDIDILRVIALFSVFIVHSLAYYLNISTISTIWNYLHFGVVGLVFCSGYISVQHILTPLSSKALIPWFWKRFKRLYLPFLVYLLFYMILVKIFPGFFRGQTIKLNFTFLFQSLFFLEGIDIGWLTLLFIQLMLLTPLFAWIIKDTTRFIGYAIFVGIIIIYNLIYPIPSTYSRIIAWLPWSLIYLIGARIALQNAKKQISRWWFLIMGITLSIIWLILWVILLNLGILLTLTRHKYPPDIFYLLYGTWITSGLLFFISFVKHIPKFITQLIIYLSQNSYGLFLLQLIVLDFMVTTFHPKPLLTILFSILITTSINGFWNFLKRVKITN